MTPVTAVAVAWAVQAHRGPMEGHQRVNVVSRFMRDPEPTTLIHDGEATP